MFEVSKFLQSLLFDVFLVFSDGGPRCKMLIVQDGQQQYSISQHEATQAGPAAEADRGVAEAETGESEQEDRAERPEGGREEQTEQQQERVTRL